MIQPLPLYIGLRYTRAKRRNHFISFISLASMIGIALGVAVLITVLSVMNGFDYQIRSRFFAIAPQVTVMTSRDITSNWKGLAKKINTIPGITGIAPYVSGNGMAIRNNQILGLQIVGIDPQQENKVSHIESMVTQGSLQQLIPGQFHMVIGKTLASTLGLRLNESINLFTPQLNMTLAGTFPRFRSFKNVGVFESSGGFGFENSLVFIHLNDAQKLFPAGVGISGLHIQLKNLYDADKITQQIQKMLPFGFAVSNWTMGDGGAFFHALVMEKIVLFVILLLIVAVAAFNLVSTLVMVVNDKRADIAILRTLGASPRTIMLTFIIQGAIIGLVGVLLGLIAGLLLAANITHIADWVQNLFHIQFLSSSVFLIDYLPSRIQWMDVVNVCIAAWALSLLATLYPAILAFKTQPAEALRYE